MPRLTNRTPRLCRDRLQAYTKIDGERVQLGRWGTAQAREEYDRVIGEWLAKADNDIHSVDRLSESATPLTLDRSYRPTVYSAVIP